MKSRGYRMQARADAVAATGAQILAAAQARLMAQSYDEVMLDDVAADAGVTVQTVLRRFGSKEGLVRAIAGRLRDEVVPHRDSAPAGKTPAALRVLIDHYEQFGDIVMQVLRQELRIPVFAEITAFGRSYHDEWVSRVFQPWLDRAAHRDILHAQLVAACDVYTWFLLRRQTGLSRRDTEDAIRGLVEGVLK